MARLAEILTQPEVRPQVVKACVVLIDAEVASKSGFSGLAVKAGYKLVKAIKPTMIGDVVDKLLRSVREPFKVAGADVPIQAHVGVAQFPQDGKQPDQLLRHASSAALLGAYTLPTSANE